MTGVSARTHRGQLPFGPGWNNQTREQPLAADRKTRGGFYTPGFVAEGLADRLLGLYGNPDGPVRVLEPTAGDGSFFPALRRVFGNNAGITAVEICRSEANECARAAGRAGIDAHVINDDYLLWRLENTEKFDVAVGNPPFVRSHQLDEATKTRMRMLHAGLNLPYSRMANLWTGVILGALADLRTGGVFAFVVPYELLAGTAAKSVRDWLARNAGLLRIDLLPGGLFEGALQGVVAISGQNDPGAGGSVTVGDQTAATEWTHSIRPGMATWGFCLLTPAEWSAVEHFRRLSSTAPMGTVARFEVSTLTGANGFFLADAATVEKYQLGPWAVPLLYQLKHTPGLVHTTDDHANIKAGGWCCAMLDFSADRPDPMNDRLARRYIKTGEQNGLHTRYKTRNRRLWYRAPHIRPGQMILPLNSHLYPRMVVNAAQAVTTNSIFRGWMTKPGLSPEDLTAGFHNSLTLLTAEIEGRPAGGGALVLLPSQTSRLVVPAVQGFGTNLTALNHTARTKNNLVEATNRLLIAAGDVPAEALDVAERARRRLQERRLVTNMTVGQALPPTGTR